MRLSTLVVSACAISLVLLTANAAAPCTTPLPTDMAISPPATSVPSEFAKFSGAWGGGKWDGKLCHTLVVTQVDAGGAVSAIYSFGRYTGWNIDRGDWFPTAGVIEDGELKLERFRNGARASYRFEGDKLRGTYRRGSGTSRVLLTRQ